MKQGSGMEDREERSKGIEIRIADAFTIIKPTTPFIIGSQPQASFRGLTLQVYLKGLLQVPCPISLQVGWFIFI
jgi:hypothetical protein